jgi:hypothetical protein
VGTNVNRDERHGQKGAISNPNVKTQLSHCLCCATKGLQTRGNAHPKLDNVEISIYGESTFARALFSRANSRAINKAVTRADREVL